MSQGEEGGSLRLMRETRSVRPWVSTLQSFRAKARRGSVLSTSLASGGVVAGKGMGMLARESYFRQGSSTRLMKMESNWSCMELFRALMVRAASWRS